MPTKIEWAEETWNPVTGCTPVSEGCENCYARRMAHRLRGRYGYPADEPFRVTLHPERLKEPWSWQKRRLIFVCSMGDLFHEDVPDSFIDEVFGAISQTPGLHKFLVLTKRPERMRGYFAGGKPSPRIWLGVTAENQARADDRIRVLLKTPAAVRFVSCEPLLGPVDLTRYLKRWRLKQPVMGSFWRPQLDWVIVGAETGPGRRTMQPSWSRDVKDQCVVAGVPFFFKQAYRNDGTLWRLPELDGRVWDEYPEIGCQTTSP